MSRSTLIIGSALGILLGIGCDTVSEPKAVGAQPEASSKIATIVKEADVKIGAAHLEAEKKIADAQASFMKLREDYRNTTATNLEEFDHKMADLEIQENQAKGKAKAELEAKLRQIRANRAAFAADYQKLEVETAAEWDATKARLDKQWQELKAQLD